MTLDHQATVVCVLGMARSGTSLTARALNLLGVYLGPEEALLQPRQANPGGFWEHYRLMRLNERILHTFGGNWRDPPLLPDGWEASAELEDERREAEQLLEDTFAGRTLWGWKDPRNSLTLPFWQRLLPEMRYVVCVRNPIDVAASIERRDGIPAARAFELWLLYVASALAHTAAGDRIVIAYEDWFEDWRGAAERLGRFLSHSEALDSPETTQRIAEAVQSELWHHRTAAADVLSEPRLPLEARSLYLTTELLTRGVYLGSEEAVGEFAIGLCAGRRDGRRRPSPERRELERRLREVVRERDEIEARAKADQAVLLETLQRVRSSTSWRLGHGAARGLRWLTFRGGRPESALDRAIARLEAALDKR